MVPQSYYRCWVEVDLDALRHNVRAVRRRIGPDTKLMAVVKADAYGHGLRQVAQVLMEMGVDSFAVANLAEALVIRQLGGSGWPILLLGCALPFEINAIIEQKIIPTISTIEEAAAFAQEAAHHNRCIDVHVEIDTGMGRVGFWHEEAIDAIRQMMRLPQLRIAAVYTHFPSADENPTETRRELHTFQRVLTELEQTGCGPVGRHAANSAALLTLPAAVDMDYVRPGLLLYGIPPIAVKSSGTTTPEFIPVLSFKARVAFVKYVSAGRTISYGQTFVAPSPMTIATVAAGYSDGFSRHLSNHAEVLLGGRRCRVVGRVTMDQIMVDVTGSPDVRSGDEVVLIGRQGGGEITAIEMATWADTIAWETLCGITKSARVPRVYHGLSAS